jgi:hypothetical protein
MRKLQYILIVFLLSLTVSVAAQKSFHAYLINNEYDVYLRINFYDEDISIPGQELYGQVPGFLGKKHNSFCWVITSAQIKGNAATLSMINDYGSEDLVATLTQKNDSVYVLKQDEGSTLKVPKNGKWQKLPKTLEFKRQKE